MVRAELVVGRGEELRYLGQRRRTGAGIAGGIRGCVEVIRYITDRGYIADLKQAGSCSAVWKKRPEPFSVAGLGGYWQKRGWLPGASTRLSVDCSVRVFLQI